MLVQHPEGRAFPVMFVGDIQFVGTRSNAVSLSILKENLQRGLDIGAWFLGMGDYLDTFSPSNRARLRGANLFETAEEAIDDQASDRTQELFDIALRPTKGRWLGLLAGHHWHKFRYGDTTDMRLAGLLDTEFLGDCATIRLVFHMEKNPRSCSIPGVIWAHHGTGNGQTGYYPLGRLEKVAAWWEEVDVFAMGHTTKQATESGNKLRSRWGNRASNRTWDLSHRKVLLVGSGGYSKTYVEGAMQGQVPSGGYAEKGMMNPAIMGSPVVWFFPKQSSGKLSLDLRGEA
jgi:hypothetical protein